MPQRLLPSLLAVCMALAGCETVSNVRESVASSFASISDTFFGPSAEVPAGTTPEAGQSANRVVSPATLQADTRTHISGTVPPQAVIDGDTILLSNRRIRLYGIDAPERSQQCVIQQVRVACGVIARYALMGFVTGATVRCERADVDRYGRDVSRCYADGFDLSAGMVKSGLAVAYRQYSEAYVSDEEAAKRLNRGMWRGAFDMPWDWRAQRR